MPRIRRPLLALIVLVLVLVIGYAVRAARTDGSGVPAPTHSGRSSVSAAQSAADATR